MTSSVIQAENAAGRASFCQQLKYLLYRQRVFIRREPQAIMAKFANQIFIGILILFLFSGAGDSFDSLSDFQNQAGAAFFLIVSTLMGWYFGTILTFQIERPVFLREQASKMYSPLLYFTIKNLTDSPVAAITPFIVLLVVYWGIPLTHFFQIYLSVMLLSNTAFGMGLFISSAANDITSATTVAPILTMPMILFGGLFANVGAMPAAIRWLQWVSPVRFTNEALLTAWYQGMEGFPQEFLKGQGYTLGYTNCILALVGWLVFWRVLAYIMLISKIENFQ